MFAHRTQLSFDLAEEPIFGHPETDADSEPLPGATSGRRLWPGVAVLAVAAVIATIPVAEHAFSVGRSAPAESTPPVVVPPVMTRHERERPRRPL